MSDFLKVVLPRQGVAHSVESSGTSHYRKSSEMPECLVNLSVTLLHLRTITCMIILIKARYFPAICFEAQGMYFRFLSGSRVQHININSSWTCVCVILPNFRSCHSGTDLNILPESDRQKTGSEVLFTVVLVSQNLLDSYHVVLRQQYLQWFYPRRGGICSSKSLGERCFWRGSIVQKARGTYLARLRQDWVLTIICVLSS